MEELTTFFKLLSDDTRIRILLLLRKQKLCVCQLCEILEEQQPKISKHLAKLRDLGLIKDERNEQYIFYSLKIENELYIKILDVIAEESINYSIFRRDIDRNKKVDELIDIRKSVCERK